MPSVATQGRAAREALECSSSQEELAAAEYGQLALSPVLSAVSGKMLPLLMIQKEQMQVCAAGAAGAGTAGAGDGGDMPVRQGTRLEEGGLVQTTIAHGRHTQATRFAI